MRRITAADRTGKPYLIRGKPHLIGDAVDDDLGDAVLWVLHAHETIARCLVANPAPVRRALEATEWRPALCVSDHVWSLAVVGWLAAEGLLRGSKHDNIFGRCYLAERLQGHEPGYALWLADMTYGPALSLSYQRLTVSLAKRTALAVLDVVAPLQQATLLRTKAMQASRDGWRRMMAAKETLERLTDAHLHPRPRAVRPARAVAGTSRQLPAASDGRPVAPVRRVAATRDSDDGRASGAIAQVAPCGREEGGGDAQAARWTRRIERARQ